MIRIILMPVLLLASVTWGISEWTIKKNPEKGKEIISITVFWGAIWALIFYWLLN